MVRVIGRIDLADEVHRALGAAGIESYVVTAGPRAAAESTGKDGSDADLLVYDPPDVDMCGYIKRIVPHRPVVMVTPAKHERPVLANMRYASGPDAHVVWPASGEDLRAAIARAHTVAGSVRPLLRKKELVTFALVLALMLGSLVLRFRDMKPIAEALNALANVLLGVYFWMHATFTSTRTLYRFFGGAILVFAALRAIMLLVW